MNSVKLRGKDRKYPERFFLKFSCVGYSAVGAQRNLWPGGLCSLEIMKIIWENDATVQIQIIMYYFKEIGGRYFQTQPRVSAFSEVRRICFLFIRHCAVLEIMSFDKLLDSYNTHKSSAKI